MTKIHQHGARCGLRRRRHTPSICLLIVFILSFFGLRKIGAFLKLYNILRWSEILHVRSARRTQSTKFIYYFCFRSFFFLLFFFAFRVRASENSAICVYIQVENRVKFETAKPMNKIAKNTHTHRISFSSDAFFFFLGGRELSPSEQITDAHCHIDLSLIFAIYRTSNQHIEV